MLVFEKCWVSMSLDSFAWEFFKPGTVHSPWMQMTLNDTTCIKATWSKVKVTLLGFVQLLCAQFLLTSLIESRQNLGKNLGTMDALWEEMFSIDFLVALAKVKVKLLVLELILSAQYSNLQSFESYLILKSVCP